MSLIFETKLKHCLMGFSMCIDVASKTTIALRNKGEEIPTMATFLHSNSRRQRLTLHKL